jgi:asparagine N-glycosylation enzyme membrane subunit Stt3
MFTKSSGSKLNANEVSNLILLAALLFGTVFRFFPAWLAGSPINDGGMFYVMMKDLQTSHFLPPEYTTYNNLNIPFAYPPLALYIGAGIGSLFNISLIEILRWLPALVNSLCVLVFYFLSQEFLDDKFKSAVAALIFALTPGFPRAEV